MRRPDFLIVGAPKCGTTSMFSYLGQHPGVHAAKIKEPHHFGSDLPDLGIHIPKLRDSVYHSLFDGARADQITGEASVWYLYSERAAKEIAEALPEAKVIIMLRDPPDFIASLHNLYLYLGWEQDDDLERALQRESLGGPVPYRPVARFAEQVARYYDALGRDRVHVIVYDDLVRDTRGVFQDVCRFLRIDPTFTTDFAPVNPSGLPDRGILWRAWFGMSASARRRIKSMIPLADPRVRHAYLAIQRRFTAAVLTEKPRSRPSEALRAQLTAEMAEDVSRLSQLIGRDLSHWARP